MSGYRIGAIVLLSAPLAAQWLNYPTPGLPRTADGQPNLTAPAPRTADGKPDRGSIATAIPIRKRCA